MFTTAHPPSALRSFPTATGRTATINRVCLVFYLLSVMDLNFEEMNKWLKKEWIIIAAASWLSGCLPDPLDVKNVPTLQPHIVVSSQVIPGQSIAILLTKSIGALA